MEPPGSDPPQLHRMYTAQSAARCCRPWPEKSSGSRPAISYCRSAHESACPRRATASGLRSSSPARAASCSTPANCCAEYLPLLRCPPWAATCVPSSHPTLRPPWPRCRGTAPASSSQSARPALRPDTASCLHTPTASSPASAWQNPADTAPQAADTCRSTSA